MKYEYQILLVEDDPNLGMITKESLELQGFRVTLCKDGESGMSTFLQGNFDVCLVDVMLPKKDGFQMVKEIRKINQDVPILFITAKALKEDRITGFKIGGDDYITKPFSMEELVLRIQAMLRRVHKDPEFDHKHQFTLGSFTFDYDNSLLKNGQSSQKLTFKESELLYLLCIHEGQILERELALTHVWGDNSFFTARSMDVYISRLRKYLKTDPSIEIANIHGRGYRMMVSG